MNKKDPQLNQLYKDGATAQPPKSIDDAIIARANQANQKLKYSQLRPWLAAASILFAVPILWLMVQQPEMQQTMQESLQPEPAPSISLPDEKPQPQAVAPLADTSNAMHDGQDMESTQRKVTVNRSPIRSQKDDSNNAGLKAPSENNHTDALYISKTEQKQSEEVHISESAKPVEPSLETEAIKTPAEPISLRYTKNKVASSVETMTDLIKQIQPTNLTKNEHELWHDLQQQLDKQQWQQAQQTLEQLETIHPDIDYSNLSDYLKKLIMAE